MKKTSIVMIVASAILTVLFVVGCGNDTVKTETKTVTEVDPLVKTFFPES